MEEHPGGDVGEERSLGEDAAVSGIEDGAVEEGGFEGVEGEEI